MDPRAPVKIVGVELDPNHIIVTSHGEMRQAPMIYLTEEDMGRINAGYVCAKCFEVQGIPFPKECSVCKFPMSDQQAEFVAKSYEGTVRLGPSTTYEEENAIMNEWAEKEAFKRDRMPHKPQIWVPGSI